MKRLLLLAIAFVPLTAAADAPPAATYKSEAELHSALAAGQGTPTMLASPVSISDRHRINLIKRTQAAGAVAHPGFAELHHIVDGSGTLVTGGTMVPGSGRGGATIQNGESKRVSKGDVILIPSGMPHWYKDLDGTITYLEVRWEEK
ncbi:MAG TPA: cupin domain-containing protein [Vicinamibacterales bacterium]|nr:cupin domain-containing protein [Vicinamibacterales bacterium]